MRSLPNHRRQHRSLPKPQALFQRFCRLEYGRGKEGRQSVEALEGGEELGTAGVAKLLLSVRRDPGPCTTS